MGLLWIVVGRCGSFPVLVTTYLHDGFHSDVIRLQSQKSEILRILIYTRLKINKKQIFV